MTVYELDIKEFIRYDARILPHLPREGTHRIVTIKGFETEEDAKESFRLQYKPWGYEFMGIRKGTRK